MPSTTYSSIAATSLGQIQELRRTTPSELDPDQVLVKVQYSALAVFDLYQADFGFFVQSYPWPLGASASGIVVSVGSGVADLKEGDRVVAFSFSANNPGNKGLQEYTVLSRSVISKVPEKVTLSDAVTVPDNFVTAFYTLFNQAGLPWAEVLPPKESPSDANRSILVYGAGATTGQYMIQLLKLAKYTNVIAAASPKHDAYLRSIGATHVVDYNSPSLADDIAEAIGGDRKIDLAIDCVSLNESLTVISKVIRPGGTFAFLAPVKYGGSITGESAEFLLELPQELGKNFPEGVNPISVTTYLWEQDPRMYSVLMKHILPKLLDEGYIKPVPIALIEQGNFLERVNAGLGILRANKAGGKKVVVKVGE